MAAVKERDVAMQEKMIGDLENRVFELIAFWQQSQQQQQWYFPKTSWTSLAGDANKAIEDWAGSFERTGERDYSPGYARMLAGERDFSEEADYELLRKNAIHLYALINLTLSTEQGT
jgi:exodeoxyribonuclease V gamma subunit